MTEGGYEQFCMSSHIDNDSFIPWLNWFSFCQNYYCESQMSRSEYKFEELVDIPTLSEMLDKLYEIAHIPSAIIDIEGNVLTGAGWQRICLDFHRKNPEAEKICIKSDSYIRGKDICDINQMSKGQVQQEMERATEEKPQHFYFQHRLATGEIKDVEVYSGPITRHGEKLLYSIIHDVSERRKVEIKLRNQRALLESIFRSAPVGIALAQNRVLSLANKSMEEISGYSSEELEGQSARMLYPTLEEFEKVDREKYALIREFGTGTVETKWQRKDGTIITVRLSFTAINLKDLSQGITFTAIDISDRKQKEEQLRKSKKEWERTFNAINDIVTLQDTSMKIVKINKIGCDTLDLSCGNIIGHYCYELFHGSNEPCPECPVLATQETFEPYTKEMTHEKLGKTFLVSAAPVLDDQRNLTHIVHVAKDITEKKKIEEQLFLNEKLATIAGLAAGVAHEINTPLSAILQSQQIIEMKLDPDKPRNQERAAECGVDLSKVKTYFKKNELDVFMKGMRNSAITAGNIIKNLLEFSRSHKGEISNANLSNLLDTTLELASADYDLKKKYNIINVEIVKEYDSGLTEMPCVAMEIEQVILNLVKNAVHAMADDNTENPCIIVRTVKTEKMARIEVEDNGTGINKETQPYIFDPFFTTKEVGAGTGLGLSVSHALIVDKHKGNIWVESESGKGAKFIVELPLSQEV
jgi:PAS domain S-box-containing protein